LLKGNENPPFARFIPPKPRDGAEVAFLTERPGWWRGAVCNGGIVPQR